MSVWWTVDAIDDRLGRAYVWQDHAACRGMSDPDSPNYDHRDIFFPESGTVGKKMVAEAKTICARCTVQESCLADALESGESWGIRAGTTPDERRVLLGRRPKNRRLR